MRKRGNYSSSVILVIAPDFRWNLQFASRSENIDGHILHVTIQSHMNTVTNHLQKNTVTQMQIHPDICLIHISCHIASCQHQCVIHIN